MRKQTEKDIWVPRVPNASPLETATSDSGSSKPGERKVSGRKDRLTPSIPSLGSFLFHGWSRLQSQLNPKEMSFLRAISCRYYLSKNPPGGRK